MCDGEHIEQPDPRSGKNSGKVTLEAVSPQTFVPGGKVFKNRYFCTQYPHSRDYTRQCVAKMAR